jgi:hypothetical protein
LRKLAFDWLRADLALRVKQLEDKPADGAAVQEVLHGWQTDSDLAGLRDAASLVELPPDEQTAFTRLWADVAAVLKTVEASPATGGAWDTWRVLRFGALHAWLGQDREYAATCDFALRLGKGMTDPTTADRMAKALRTKGYPVFIVNPVQTVGSETGPIGVFPDGSGSLPISMPVGEAVMGRVFDVTGNAVDEQGPVKADKYLPIHRAAAR